MGSVRRPRYITPTQNSGIRAREKNVLERKQLPACCDLVAEADQLENTRSPSRAHSRTSSAARKTTAVAKTMASRTTFAQTLQTWPLYDCSGVQNSPGDAELGAM